MPITKVYHSQEHTTLLFGKSIMRKEDVLLLWGEGKYELVAVMNVDKDTAYVKTQTTNSTFLPKGERSSTIGDVFVEDDVAFIFTPDDWIKLDLPALNHPIFKK